MKTNFDIFIGGPMGERGNDGAGTPYSEHLSRITEAVEIICRELNATDIDDHVRFDAPPEGSSGSIPDTIFGLIDLAELGILDVSAGSAGVMYELTLMHALGIPVIPIELKHRVDQGALPFYLSHSYVAIVENFKVETLVAALRRGVEECVVNRVLDPEHSSNLISKYYDGLALVDVSATTGIATGYFENFVRHVIKETDSVFDKNKYLKKFIVLKPESIPDVARMNAAVRREIEEIGLKVQHIGERDGDIYSDPEHIREGMKLTAVGKYLFDAPAPLKVQKASPRYRRIAKLRARTESPEAVIKVQKLEEQMIKKFFDTLIELSNKAGNVDPNLMVFKSPREFIEMLKDDGAEAP